MAEYQYDSDKINQLNIVEVAQDFGLDLYPKGRYYQIYCPNKDHDDEKLGNCIIKPNKNRFVCYACGKKGRVIDLVMLIEDCDFYEALETLGEKYNMQDEVTGDIFKGLTADEYAVFNLYNVHSKYLVNPGVFDSNYQSVTYRLRDLAHDNSELHDSMLTMKLIEKLEELVIFHDALEKDMLLCLSDAYYYDFFWDKWLKERGDYYIRLYKKGLMDKTKADKLFLSNEEYLFRKIGDDVLKRFYEKKAASQ